MTLDEFIDKVFNRYVCATNEEEKREEYASNLIGLCGKIDFYKLLDVISKNNDKDFVPPVKNVIDWAKHCYKPEYKKANNEWQEVKVYDPIYNCIRSKDVFPKGTSKERMIKTYEKMFPGSSGWQIIEVW